MAGGELVLDDKFLKLLFQVDDRIKKISQSSGVASESLIKMFDGVSKRSVPKIIKQLQQLQQYYTEIGKDDSKGMKRLANNARKAAEDINRLIQATQQFQSTRGRRGVTQSQTLSQDRESIERLRESQERLNRTTEASTNQTQRNSRAQREQQTQTDRNANSTNNLTRSHRGLLDISNQLQRKLALIFSVSQIQKYIGKIVQVRKEFELQQKALGAILRDQDRANELWDKTLQLAVKSPFSVKELITYTKQLAAYRIETDKLHDTTRMLADVSAGLGVDMNRIILAFGQVRAAEFLRGTELRQFTEAGIPLLEELANYFSELEGRAVSTADVFERISKRMVLFKDVEQVFRDMTSEGGVFYQMQEKQSETLYGQIRNLYDSIDIMMNDIGKDKNGAIQMFIRLAKSAADNWRLLEPIINSVGIAFATHFGAKTLISVVKYLSKAVVAMRNFGTATATATAAATQSWLTLAALIGTAIYEIITYKDELTAALDEIDRNVSKELQQSITSYKKLAEAITDVTKTTQEQEEARKRLQRQFKDMLPDYLLEVEKFEDLSDAYLKAEQSLRTYFNSKALEQKKDKIEQHFQEDIDTEIANIVSATRKNIEELRGVEAETKKKLKDWVGISVAQSIEAAKEGLIEIEDLENDITKRLAKAVEIDEQLLRKGYIRGSLVSSTYQDEMLDDMRKTLTKRNEMLEELKGLPFESFAQRDAAEMKHAMEEEIKTVEWYYSKMANVLKKVANGTTTLQKAEDDRAKLWQQALAQSPNFEQYAKVLDNTWKQLVEASKKGIYEYNKSLGDIKASIYLGEGGLKDIAGSKATGTNAQESMFTNFSETIEMRGKDIMGKPMQKAIVGAFDYAIQKSSLSDKGKELLAQFIPDEKTTTSTVRKNIEGFITRIDDLQKEYDIATSHGALFVPDEDDQRAIDAYLQGNVELLSVYKELKPVLSHIYGLLGGEGKGKQKKDSLADERIRVVDDMYKKYREVVERFGHTEAMEESFKAFKDAFVDAYKGIEWIPTDIKSMTAEDFVNEVLGFPSEEKIIEFFEKLANTVKNHEDKIKTELAKGKYVYELELRTQVEKDKDVIQSIEQMFGQYELSLELKDLGVSEDLAKTLFDVDSIDLDDIKASIQQKLKDALSSEGREEYIKELKGLLQKVGEMEAKALKDRIKNFYKFLQDTTDAIQVAQQKSALDIQFATELFNSGKLTAQQYNQAIRKIIADTNKEISKLNLDKFKDSPEYIAAMGDMAGYTAMELTKLQDTIKNLIANSSSTMSPEEIKAYNDALNKINDQLDRLKSPFSKTAISEIKEINRLNKDIDAEKAKQLELEKQRKDLEIQEMQLTTKLNNLKYHGAPQQEIDETISKIQETQKGIAKVNGEINTTAGNIEDIGSKLQKLYGGTSKGWAKANKALTETFMAIDGAVQIFNEVKDLAESFGADVDTGKWAELSIIMQGIADMSQKFQSSWQSFINKDIVGGIAGAIGGIFSIIKMFNSLHDDKLEQKIKRQAKAIEDLNKAYEKLQEDIEVEYDMDAMTALTDDAISKLDEQIDAYESMIELEQEKKKTDQEKIDEYYDEREKKLAERETLLAKQVQEAGGFGDKEAYKSAAEDFVDAWLSAYQETGNGLSGLDEQFDEFFNNMVKKQLLNRGMKDVLENFYASFDGLFGADDESGAKATEAELEALKSTWDDIRIKADNVLQSITDVMGVSDDIRNEGGLGTLQKGIQGITEDQADVVAAFLNSLRFMVGEQNSYMQNIDTKCGDIDAPNTILGQLRLIADNTASIHKLLRSVTTATGHSQGGYGIKVIM